MEPRILGVDYGDRRIGLSVSDPLGMTAQPLGTFENNQQFFDQLKSMIALYHVKHIVIGLPKNQHGGDSEKAKDVRQFGLKIQTEMKQMVTFWDERFSTIAATKHLQSAGLNWRKRKKVVDTQAAVFILQGFLDSK